MFFKLTHGKETHIYNPKENPSLSALRSYVQSAFKSLPQTFQFSYLDDENDQITLSNQEDFKIMRQTSNKVVKIFIKESQFEFFDQTAKVQLDDQVQKLAEEVSQKQTQQKEEFVHIVQEPKAPEQKEEKIVPKKELPNQIQVAQAKIQSKLKQLMPQLIEKVKQEIVKQSSIRGSVKSQVKSEISVEKEKIIHKVTCQECGIKDFEGIRYKCPVCEEFNLCQKCETTSEHPHPFLKIKHPKQAQIRIRGDYNNQKHNFLEFNGHKSPIDKIPFVRDIKNMAQGFFGMEKKPEIKEGFKDRKIWGRQCPYYKGFNQFAEWKQESHVQNLNQNENKPEQKKEEKKVEQQDQGLSRIMKNAQYLAEILGIDFNRCMKFAQKNPTLSQQQLLELYFENTNQLA